MKIGIKLYGEFKKYAPAGGDGISLDTGGTVGHALKALGFSEKDLGYAMVLVNNIRVKFDRVLKDGDHIDVFQPIGGGGEKPYRYVGKAVPRIDARDKVTGRTKYSTDLSFPGMLWAKTKRSDYPHAKILSISTQKAESLPGVEAVLTADDIPGHNGFGIITPNWPVLCMDRVLYMGDAVALVAAVDEETAEEACRLIEVEYEELPVVTSPEEALKEGAPRLHEKGNIMHTMELRKGDVEKGLEEADVVVEGAYSTQFMDHAFIEPPGGVAIYDEANGVITVWCGDQYAFRDQLQIARSMGWDPRKIRVIGSPTGGAFGGKDEITVQIHLALLAYHTKKPVKLWWTREETLVVNAKRHAMTTRFRIGARNDGRFTAIDVDVTADTGPYDTIGAPILNLSLESSPGPYQYPHSHFNGRSVYTNNAIGGEFRGFGAPQVVWGVEQEIDRIAEKLGIGPIEIRKRNALKLGDISSLGHTMQTSVGITETLEATEATELWQDRKSIIKELNERFPHRLHGVGVASEWHAVGMGVGIPDFANVDLEVCPDGRVILKTGAIEIGQGNITAYAQMLAEALEIDIARITVVHGDTFETPDSGSVTASRSVLVNGNAILDGCGKLKKRAILEAASLLVEDPNKLVYGDGSVYSKSDPGKRASIERIAEICCHRNQPLREVGANVMAISDKDFGDGLPHNYYTFITQMALVGVDVKTGQVDVLKVVSVPEMGKAINIHGVEGQSEGGVVMGQGYTLYEDLKLENGEFLTKNFTTYIIPTSMDVPDIETIIVEVPEKSGPFGAKGLGEAPTVPISPAIMNAVHDATGIRINDLPVTPEKVINALKEKGE